MPDDEQNAENMRQATRTERDEGADPTSRTDEDRGGTSRPEGAKGPSSDHARGAGGFRPEDIAARVAGLGEETDADRIAREEESKLRERRQQRKDRRGLEGSASKRLAKIGERTVKRPSSLAGAAALDADPLLERTAHLGQWLKEHSQVFGGLIAIALIGAGGLIGWLYWQNKHDADASALLAQAFADEHGHVAPPAANGDAEEGDSPKLLYPTFKSAADRRDAAITKYRQVESKYAGTGAAILARLSEAGLLIDKGDAPGALAAYKTVEASALGKADPEVRGRAFEGIGFAEELLAKSDAAGKDKHLGDALAAFKSLEQTDMKGFKALGKYHQARVLLERGDQSKAIDLLKEVHKLVTESGESHPFSYLELAVTDRLRELDPSALPRKAAPSGGVDMSDPKIQELLRQLQQQHPKGGAAPSAPPGAHP